MSQKLNHKIYSVCIRLAREFFPWSFSAYFVLSFVGCTWISDYFSSSTLPPPPAQDLIQRPVPSLKTPPSEGEKSSAKYGPGLDRRVKNLILLLTQADQIHREVLWVLLKDRPPEGKSFFGKTQRALIQSRGQKLTGKSAFRCDQYDVTFQSGKMTGLPLSFTFFEICSKSQGPKKFATLQMSSEGKFIAKYESEGLEEIVGIGSSILNKTMTCEVRLQGESVISQLSCDLILHDKNSEEIYELKKYVYVAGENSLISIEGNLLKNLVAQRKISVNVPLVGKIKMSEVELIPEPVDPRQAREEIEEQKQKEQLGPGAQPLAKEPGQVDGSSAAEFSVRSQMQQPPVRLHPNIPPGGPLVDEQGYPLTPEQIQAIKSQQNLQQGSGGEHGQENNQGQQEGYNQGSQVQGEDQFQNSESIPENHQEGDQEGQFQQEGQQQQNQGFQR